MNSTQIKTRLHKRGLKFMSVQVVFGFRVLRGCLVKRLRLTFVKENRRVQSNIAATVVLLPMFKHKFLHGNKRNSR